MKKICWEEKVIWVEKEIWDSKGVWESKRNTKVFFYVFNFTRFYQFSAFLPAPCGSSLLWPCLLLSHNSSSLKRFQPFPTSLSTRVFSKCLFLFFFIITWEIDGCWTGIICFVWLEKMVVFVFSFGFGFLGYWLIVNVFVEGKSLVWINGVRIMSFLFLL